MYTRVRRDLRRRRAVARHEIQRLQYKALMHDQRLSPELRLFYSLRLAQSPRNGSKVRVHNRCIISGRSHGVHRRFRMSRIILRERALRGELLGLVKASW